MSKLYFQVPAHQSHVPGTPGSELLKRERAKASFQVSDLTRYLFGEEYIKRRERVLAVLEKDPAFDRSGFHYLGRTEKYLYGLKKEKRLIQLGRQLNWTDEDYVVAEELLDFQAAFALHKSMFLKTLASQTTEEQKKLFYEPAKRFDIIGCYAQTELGHGSNVQGLETTATYDPATKTFVLHSPSLTSAKWWAGGLGRTADHAIVMAQLYTPDGPNGQLVRRGPHPFFVPIRDPVTRDCLPGRTIGDIGPKFGFNGLDNGTMLLDHVRVPHINFLSRFSKVDEATGKFTKPVNDKLSYGTMTFVRASIVQKAWLVLARAATVSIRYCSVRCQFVVKQNVGDVAVAGQPENPVLDYPSVQARLFVPLVQAFAFRFTGKEMFRQYDMNEQAMANGDFSQLADLHAASAGLKALCTITAAQGIEDCRRACGGHGYSLASGLGTFYSDYLPEVTWEGDSYMLPQQVGRYLFKTFRLLAADPTVNLSAENQTRDYMLKFLSNPNATAGFEKASDLENPQLWVEAFGHRAAYAIADAVHKLDKEGVSWNDLLPDILRCSIAHSQSVVVKNFAKAILHDQELRAKPELHKMMSLCFQLFVCHTLNTEAGDFFASGCLIPTQHRLVRKQIPLLLAQIRPEAVSLVDAFGFPDFQLSSVLGRYDGNVYPGLMQFAQAEPLNGVKMNIKIDDPQLVAGSTVLKAHL